METCWSTPYIKHAYDEASSVIAVSQALRRSLTCYSSKTEQQIDHIPNAVDTDFFRSNEAKDRSVFTFLNVGWLSARKMCRC